MCSEKSEKLVIIIGGTLLHRGMSNLANNYSLMTVLKDPTTQFTVNLYTSSNTDGTIYSTDDYSRPTDPNYTPKTVMADDGSDSTGYTQLNLQDAIFSSADYTTSSLITGFTISVKYDNVELLVGDVPLANPFTLGPGSDDLCCQGRLECAAPPSGMTINV